MKRPDDFTSVCATGGMVEGYLVSELAKAEFEIQEVHYYVVRQKIASKDRSEAIQRYVQKSDYTYALTKAEAEKILKRVNAERDECKKIMQGKRPSSSERIQKTLWG